MTTPRVTELPRRLEPSSPDTFLGAREPAAPARGVSEARPLAAVVQLRPRDPRAPRRPAARRRARALHVVAGPGFDSAA